MTQDNPTLYQVSPSMMDLDADEVDVFNALLAEWQRRLAPTSATRHTTGAR